MQILRRLRRWALVAATVLALPFGLAGARAADTGPAIWQVTGAGGIVFMFGTIHLLPPQTQWQSNALQTAIRASDSLTLEIADLTKAAPTITNFTMENGFYRDGRTLRSTLDDDQFQRLDALARQLGLSMSGLQTMRPWLAAISLTLQYAQTRGFAADVGAESWLTQVFTAMDRPVLGLESPLAALEALAGHDDAVQAAMLVDTVDELAGDGALLDTLHDRWLGGEVDALEELLVERLKEEPAVYRSILVERNANWAPKIAVLADTPGIHMVAVGAAHLLGEDSVLEMLAAQGYKVSRLSAVTIAGDGD